jgi:hypothetical protein
MIGDTTEQIEQAMSKYNEAGSLLRHIFLPADRRNVGAAALLALILQVSSVEISKL